MAWTICAVIILSRPWWPWFASKIDLSFTWATCTSCEHDVATAAASIALVVLTLMYMISIVVIVLYIAFTPERNRVGLSSTCSRACEEHDLPVLGEVRFGAESDRDRELQCTICLCDVEGGQKLRKLYSCKHVFHQTCIDQWLLGTPVFSLTCPLCRAHLYEPIKISPEVADLP